MALYDDIGRGYTNYRVPDQRIADRILEALGDARTVINVGAGAGSYEPTDREVVAVEPSAEMIGQRPPGAARAVQASADALPFDDDAFDAAMAVLTVHHWPDPAKGVAELRRVARDRVVVLTWDAEHTGFWIDDYFPALRTKDDEIFSTVDAALRGLGPVQVDVVPIPHDCTDGFLGAYWRRPEAYLDANARLAISTFSKIGDVTEGVDRLRRDIESGAWAKDNAALLELEALDLGYRLMRF